MMQLTRPCAQMPCREPNSSTAGFVNTYPRGKDFELVAFEGDARFAPMYRQQAPLAGSTQTIRLVPELVSTFDGPCYFSTASSTGAHMSRTSEAGMEAARCFDFTRWLRENVSPRDLVVVKMDVEGVEFDLVPQLLRDGATLRLIDELFIECHHLETWGNGPHRYAECLQMYRALQDAGVWTHEWF